MSLNKVNKQTGDTSVVAGLGGSYGVYELGTQSIPTGITQYAISTSDIKYTETVVAIYTDYTSTGVGNLNWGIMKASSQWNIWVNNTGNSEVSVKVSVVYLK